MIASIRMGKLNIDRMLVRLWGNGLSCNVTAYYKWPLNNMGLNCTGPPIHRYFSIVNAIVLHHLSVLVEPMDAKVLGRGRADCKLYED